MRLRTSAPAASPRPRVRPRTAAALVAGVVALAAGAGVGITAAQAAEPVVADAAPAQVRAVDADAAFYLGIARTTAAAADGKVDTTGLRVRIAQLADADTMPQDAVDALIGQLRTSVRATSAALKTWEAEQAAAAAAAQAAAEALAAANSPEGARGTARAMAADRFGWGDGQFSCLDSLWTKESSWDFRAENPSSGAYGIPQSLPGDKMATVGADWRENAATQIAWGLDYISRAYGTPCAAWSHSQATDWY
ncbi:aggregation-promoting factor C-terminal-like domain-containing protein [Microbacterium sp. GXF7504]